MSFRILLMLLVLAGSGWTADSFPLSEKERAWIAAHPVVRIQMSSSSPPFEFRAGGRWQGLAYDHLEAACRRIGLRIEVTEMSWEEALDAVATGRGVDLLLAVTRSPERAQQMLLTTSYLAFPQVIIADRNRGFISSLHDLEHAVVAVERDYVMESWLRRDLPEAQLVTTDGSPPALLLVSQGQAQAYVGNLAVASHIINQNGLVNLGVVAPSGYGDEEFAMGVRRDWPELVAMLDRAFAEIHEQEATAIRERWLTVRYEHGLRYADIVLWVLAVAGIALLFIVQLRRMVARRTRELAREAAQRREGEARFRLLIDRASEAIVLLDPQTGTFIEANPRAERIYGVPRQRILGARPDEFSPEFQPDGERSIDKVRRYNAATLAGSDQEFGWLHHRPDGTEVPCEVRLTALPWDGRTMIRCSVIDLTERRSYEAQLRRSETLANLGLLAGGVAHDFNNVLTAVLGYAELIGITTSDDKIRAYASGIGQAVDQAHSQTRRLLAFARRKAIAPGRFDIHAAIETAIDLFSATRHLGIAVIRQLDASPCWAQGYAGQIQNAVLNLCFNARDAMPQGGRLTLRTTVETLGPDIIASFAPYALKPGAHCHLSITDTGCGMTPEVLARCLEPLFTTKGEQGTGLGLPGVHVCVVEHHGAMRIDSVPGQGTTVHLWLPVSG
jgi:PAS domain S-box-containing protein